MATRSLAFSGRVDYTLPPRRWTAAVTAPTTARKLSLLLYENQELAGKVYPLCFGGNRLLKMHDYPGRLIVVEGIDGSGKSTQLDLLHKWLGLQGYNVFFSEWNSSD